MEGVLFDFNGTLIFDNEINFKAWSEMCQKMRGTPFTYEEYKKVNGQPAKGFIDYILNKDTSNEEAEKYTQEKEKQYIDLIMKSDLKLAPGAIQLFEELKKNNIPYTIATSSCKENVDAHIKKFELAKYFDISKITYFDYTFKGKPEPDIYLIAAKKLGVDVKKCIIFEDAKSGLESGIRAGGTVIGIASTYPVEEIEKIPGVSKAFNDYTEITLDKLKNIMKK